MDNVFYTVNQALQRGENVVLCSLIASTGSTPRNAGAKMAVLCSGEAVNTIGGGLVEYQCLELAKEIHRTGMSQVKSYQLTQKESAELGMVCGGRMEVFFQFLQGTNAQHCKVISDICTLLASGEPAWLVLEIFDDGTWNMQLCQTESGLQHWMLCDEKMLQSCTKATLLKGEPRIYIEPLKYGGTLYIFGGGHVSQALVPLAHHVAFPTVVFEDRLDFAQPELFPGADKVICGDFMDIGAQVSITNHDYVVVMTRGHGADFEVLRQIIPMKPYYLGCIGSRKKHAVVRERLWSAGITQEQTACIESPIGLEIGAQTPEEIAVSIVAQLIQYRARQ